MGRGCKRKSWATSEEEVKKATEKEREERIPSYTVCSLNRLVTLGKVMQQEQKEKEEEVERWRKGC